MISAWALVPVKPFAAAKTRLAGVLSPAECALLAEHMLRDVLRALTAASGITGIALLTREPRVAELAEAGTARLLPEPSAGDYLAALDSAAATLAAAGARHLLVLPGDLPTLSAVDVQALLTRHGPGVSICAAQRDGGSNALLLTPPTAIPMLFGANSAERHAEAARERGIEWHRLDLAAFAHDIDTPDDVAWLLGQRIACATLAWLRASGIAERFRQQGPGGPAAGQQVP